MTSASSQGEGHAPHRTIAIIGGGPAGLMAAETLAGQGVQIHVFDTMPSVGRKFLLAGRGGLNLTHSEPYASFVTRYAERADQVQSWLDDFTPEHLRTWAQGLGIDTFVGSSGRVFPTDMKAAPLLRAWLHRLRSQGVQFHMRHRWLGWTPEGDLAFATASGEFTFQADATVLALGGASWARLGSDGAWAPTLAQRGVEVAPLQASNCGFDVAPTASDRTGWSTFLTQKFAGQPIKPVAITMIDSDGQRHRQQGEFVLTETGVEGSLIYAFSARIRDTISQHGHADTYLDLLPSHSDEQVLAETSRARGPRSLSTHLKSRLGIQGLKMALLHELLTPETLQNPQALAQSLKALPVRLVRPRPMDEAISTAGGVKLESMNPDLMLHSMKSVFCAGEMLDWEAPTGGYLLTAAMASGRHAAKGVIAFLGQAA